ACIHRGLACLVDNRQIVCRKDFVDVQDHDKFLVPLPHALEKVRVQAGSDLRRWFDVLRLEFHDLMHRVRKHSEYYVLSFNIHFSDYDPGVYRLFRILYSELFIEIHDRDNCPSEVDHSPHESRGLGHLGDLREIKDLSYLGNIQRKLLFIEFERKVLPGIHYSFHTHGLLLVPLICPSPLLCRSSMVLFIPTLDTGSCCFLWTILHASHHDPNLVLLEFLVFDVSLVLLLAHVDENAGMSGSTLVSAFEDPGCIMVHINNVGFRDYMSSLG